MPVSSSIYSAIGQGVTPLEDPQNALLRALKMQGAQEEMQAQRMTRARTEEDYRRGVERSNRLQQLASGDYADDEARADAFIRGGFIDEGQKILKGRADYLKTRADARKTDVEILDKSLGVAKSFVPGIRSREAAAAYLEGLYSDPVLGPIAARLSPKEMALQNIPTDPQQLERWKAGHMAMSADKLMELSLPKLLTANVGNAQVTTGYDQFTGQPMAGTGQRQEVFQSPESVARGIEAEKSLQQRAQEAAAGRALTLRGQNMVDARARESAARADGALIADAGGPGQAAMVRQFGKAPPGYRWKPDGSAEAIPGGPADIKAGEAGAKSVAKRDAQIAQAESVLGTIRDARGLVGYSTAGAGGLAAGIPMTGARNLQAKLETVKANLGFDRLQQMRDNSPTGGALGAVAVQELTALQSTVASLDQLQSPSQLARALEKIEGHYTRWLDVMKQSGGGQGGASGSFGDKPAGKTVKRTGTQNGRKVVEYSDGSIEYAN